MTDIKVKNKDELLDEKSIYTKNAGNPAVRYWVKNDDTGKWELDLEQPFAVLL